MACSLMRYASVCLRTDLGRLLPLHTSTARPRSPIKTLRCMSRSTSVGWKKSVSCLRRSCRHGRRHDHLCLDRWLGRVHRLRRGGCRPRRSEPRRSEPRRLLARTSAQLLSCPFRTVCRRGHSSRRDLRGLKEDVISIWLTCAPIAGEALLGFHGSRKVVATCVIVGNDDLHRHRVGKSGSSRQRRELRTLSSELAHPRLEQLIRLKGTPTGSLNRSHSS